MKIHKKIVQTLDKNKRKLGDMKFKIIYCFDTLEDLMKQKKYLKDLGWEVRYETKDQFVLRGYYDVRENSEENKAKGREYREYHDRKY